MEEIYHIPAMLQETIEGLAVKPGGVYVDVTFGGGGHSRAIMEHLTPTLSQGEGGITPPQPSKPHLTSPQGEEKKSLLCTTEEGGHLYSFDQDIEAYENAKHLTPTLSQGEGGITPPQPSPQGEGEKPHLTSKPLLTSSQGEGEKPHLTSKPLLTSPQGEGVKSHMASKPLLTSPQGEGVKSLLCTPEEGGHLYSFDQDIEAYNNSQLTIDNLQFIDNPNWTFVHSNFRYLRNWMDYYGVSEIDGLIADLGVSFHHFDCPERGFSFRFSAPLDMRMNQTAKRTAADIVNSYSEEELARIFWLYGEMKNGRGIARNICKARAQKPIERTEELIGNLSPALSSREGGKTPPVEFYGQPPAVRSSRALHPSREEIRDGMELDIPTQYKKDLARLFQALRIEVNDEMGALKEMLVAAKELLKPGGRIAVLTYHSLEDRLVKNFFRSGNLEGTIEKDFYGNILTPFRVIEKGRTASEEEVARNPRSRSAKLRVAEKITPPDPQNPTRPPLKGRR